MIQRLFRSCFGKTIIPTSTKRFNLPYGVLKLSFQSSTCSHTSLELCALYTRLACRRRPPRAPQLAVFKEILPESRLEAVDLSVCGKYTPPGAPMHLHTSPQIFVEISFLLLSLNNFGEKLLLPLFTRSIGSRLPLLSISPPMNSYTVLLLITNHSHLWLCLFCASFTS
jgi:hypothetical protein